MRAPVQREWRGILVVATAICVVQLGGSVGYHVARPTVWVALGVALLSTILNSRRPDWALPLYVALWPVLMGVPRLLSSAGMLESPWPAPLPFAWLSGLLVGTLLARPAVAPSAEPPRGGALLNAFAALVAVNGVAAIVGVVLNLRDALPFSSRYVGRSLLDLHGLGPFDDFAPLASWLSWMAALALATIAKSCAGADSFRRRLIGGLVVGGVVQALIALSQLLLSDQPLNRQERAAFGTLPDIHAIGSYLLVCLTACAVVVSAGLGRRALGWMTLGVLTAGLLASGSRNSWLAAVGIVAIGMGGGFAITSLTPRLKRAAQFVLIALVVLGSGGLVYFAAIHAPGETAWTEWDAALTYRLSAFWTTGRVVADHPIAGCGLGRLYGLTAYARYAGGTAFDDLAPENAHNFFLQQLAEAGPIALLLWCAIGMALIGRCWRDDALSRACAMAAVALLLANLLAHSLLIAEYLALFAVLVGALQSPGRPRAARWVWVLPIVALALGAVQLTRPAPPVGLHPRLVGMHDWEELPDGTPYRWTRLATGPRPANAQGRWLVWRVKCTHDYVVPETPLPVTIGFDPPLRPPARFSLTDRHQWYLLAVEMPPGAPADQIWSLDAGRALAPNRVRWTDDERPLGLMIMYGGPFARNTVPVESPEWQLAPLPAR